MATPCPKCGSENTAATKSAPGKPMMKCADCGATFAKPKSKESIDPAAWRKLERAEQNRLLCEGTYGPQELVETVLISVATIKKGLGEAVTDEDGTLGWINVSKVDTVNLNRRVYPAAVMAAAVERLQPKIKEGMLSGSIDHPGYGDGALQHSPIIWRGLQIDSTTDDVKGKPEVVEGHSDGANLMAMLRAGRGIAFSTRGRGSAHLPTDAEKAKYGLESEADGDVVIIDGDYELSAIDAVDNQSCPTAYKPGNTPPASATDSTESNLTENAMKTLEELKAQNPELFKLVEADRATAIAAATKPLTDKIAAQAKLLDGLNAFLESAKDTEGLKVPTKEVVREVSAKEATETITTLKAQLDASEKNVKAEQAKLAAKDAELAKQKAEKLDLDRRAAVTEKLETLLADNAFAEQIGALVKGADNKPGKIEDEKFDTAALETFVADKTAEYEEISEGTAAGDRKIRDEKPLPKKPGANGRTGRLTPEDVRKQFAL